MNLIIIDGKIKEVVKETNSQLIFSFHIDEKISNKKEAYLIFITKNQTIKEKLKNLFDEDTKVIVEGCIEEHSELPDGIKIRVKKFNFLQSLHEKLEESFLTFDELNSFLENELDEFLKDERNNDYE